jgi:DNA repair protein RadA/Sms
LKLFNQDMIVNVTGGLRVNEPAVDLGIALAIASSFCDARPISGLVALGEVGLNGELRGVSQVERRVAEAIRLGFKWCLMPRLKAKPLFESRDIQLHQAGSIAEALRMGLTREGGREIARGERTGET